MTDRYEIREEIGKGGLGAVYKAFDNQLHREVAMKRVLTTQQATEEEVQAAAKNLIGEAQTLSSLNHPNIVTVFDVGQDKEGGFVVMELLKGETLDETVERGVLTQDDFVEVVTQTMEALIAAQAIDVLHRDLKPTNVMVIWQPSGKFQTKILDFGLAKFSKTPSVQTMDQEDAVMGSIYFMAPEQFERAELDGRSDLYQMGCVYYHALTGQYPFRGENGPQVMNAHLQHRVTPLDKLRPDMSPSVCQWVMWLINRDKENRPASAQEALERFPKNPEPPGEAVLQAIPVEETLDASTTGVHVIVPEHDAAPPAKLIVTSSAPVAQRVTAGSGPVSHGKRGATGAIDPEKKKKTLSIVGTIVGAVILAIVGIFFFVDSQNNAARTRLSDLAKEDAPNGGQKEIDLALKFLTGKKSSSEEKSEATELLSKLQGKGIDTAVLDALRSGQTPYVRWKLSQALANRGYSDAVPAMMNAFSLTTSETMRSDILASIRRIANPENADALLDALGKDQKISERLQLEEILLTIYRQQPLTDKVTGPLLQRVSIKEGDERLSLYRILGALGTDDVKTRLRSVFGPDSDRTRKFDAMAAYLSWPNRSALEQLEGLINEGVDDNLIRNKGIEAYSRMASLPAPVHLPEKIETWTKALDWTKSVKDFRSIFSGMIDNPSPETLALTKKSEGSDSQTLSGLARQASGEIDKRLKSAPVLPGNGLLVPDVDVIRGNVQAAAVKPNTDDEGKPVDPPIGTLVNWRSPGTWFVWHFKVKAAGKFGIEVLQSDTNEEPSGFRVIIGDQAFNGESKQTPSREEFAPVTLEGSVSLEPGQVHTLTLQAHGVTQPRMMDIQGIRLTAQ